MEVRSGEVKSQKLEAKRQNGGSGQAWRKAGEGLFLCRSLIDIDVQSCRDCEAYDHGCTIYWRARKGFIPTAGPRAAISGLNYLYAREAML